MHLVIASLCRFGYIQLALLTPMQRSLSYFYSATCHPSFKSGWLPMQIHCLPRAVVSSCLVQDYLPIIRAQCAAGTWREDIGIEFDEHSRHSKRLKGTVVLLILRKREDLMFWELTPIFCTNFLLLKGAVPHFPVYIICTSTCFWPWL